MAGRNLMNVSRNSVMILFVLHITVTVFTKEYSTADREEKKTKNAVVILAN